MSGYLKFTKFYTSIQKIYSNLILIFTNEFVVIITIKNSDGTIKSSICRIRSPRTHYQSFVKVSVVLCNSAQLIAFICCEAPEGSAR